MAMAWTRGILIHSTLPIFHSIYEVIRTLFSSLLLLVKIIEIYIMYFAMFNKGLCSFENGFCGLKHDNSMENQWDLNFGHTPSTNTGPRYDHTTYSQKGIFFPRDNSFGLYRKLLLPGSSFNFLSF